MRYQPRHREDEEGQLLCCCFGVGRTEVKFVEPVTCHQERVRETDCDSELISFSDKHKVCAAVGPRGAREAKTPDRRPRWMANRGSFPKLGPVPAIDMYACLVCVFSLARPTLHPLPSPPTTFKRYCTPRHPMR
jgi:hypothetical protein